MNEYTFEMMVDGVPYQVKVTPFSYNNQIRFKITYNGSEDYIFARDSKVSQFIAINDNAEDIPDNLEEKISRKLMSLSAELAE